MAINKINFNYICLTKKIITMAISDAIGLNRKSRVVGYVLEPGDFREVSPNLPQRIAVLGEANTANQSGLVLDPQEITTLKQAADLYGYGSPIYTQLRILKPQNAPGVQGIPVIVYPQAEAAGAVAAARSITPSGTVTAAGTHTVVVCGRENIDGSRYDFNVEIGDSIADITAKITDAISSVIGSPVSPTDNSTDVVLTTKWAGISSEELDVYIEKDGNEIGIDYVVASTATGSGQPAVTPALNKFENEWNTIVVNPYTASSVLDELEVFNGKPSTGTPTGRYVGRKFKPFVALFGSKESVQANLVAITDPRKEELTNVLCPAPNSKGWSMEAAANMAVLHSVVAEQTPDIDVNGKNYPDMPVPTNKNIGDMSSYDVRDALVKKGCSTVTLTSDAYEVEDLVTTYHPDGENPLQFAYCRNLQLDWNVRYGYLLLEEINVVDKVIANDEEIIKTGRFIKPKQWKAVISEYALDLALRGLVADTDFMIASIVVGLSTTNPDRLETKFSYKRTGVARISSTTATAGFNFGE